MMKVVVEPAHDTRRGYGNIQETRYTLDFWDTELDLPAERQNIWAKSDEEAREIAAARLTVKVDTRDREAARQARIFEITEEELTCEKNG